MLEVSWCHQDFTIWLDGTYSTLSLLLRFSCHRESSTEGKNIKVYESYIPIATKVSESAIHGKSIYDFSSDSKASKAYEELTKEFLKDHREKKTHNVTMDELLLRGWKYGVYWQDGRPVHAHRKSSERCRPVSSRTYTFCAVS